MFAGMSGPLRLLVTCSMLAGLSAGCDMEAGLLTAADAPPAADAGVEADGAAGEAFDVGPRDDAGADAAAPPDAGGPAPGADADASPDAGGPAPDAAPPPPPADAAPAPPADAAPPPAPGPLGRNDDPTTVVVFSQNIRMRQDNWRNIVRCLGDRACNGMGAVPDIMLFQEASCEDVRGIRSLLWKPRAEGGLDIEGWEHLCFDNPRSGGVTGHWLSNAILFRSDRFEVDESRRVEFQTGDGRSCDLRGRILPVVKLLDRPRAAAGLAERRVTVAVRHDDHFGDGIKNTCDSPDAPTVFCAWRNSKIIDETVREMGGGLLVMAGDWNYAAKYCEYEGAPADRWKYAYACTTRGIWDPCDDGRTPNLGWRDPLLEADPTVYDRSKAIDFVHVKDAGAVVLNRTARNDRPGVVGAHFYCAGHGPYSGPEGADESQKMTDHAGRLLRVHY